MLTIQQIKENYPEEIFRRNPKGIIVEYLQYELLDSIFKQKNSEKLSFIGGTAIRIIYKSQRFSEDLDFDNFGISYIDFKKLLEKAIKDMMVKSFDIHYKMVKKDAYHCYIKFPELLFRHGLSPHVNEKILVRVDATTKKINTLPKVVVLGGFDVYRKILVNNAAVILTQKLMTIIQRKREKGRDFYDVSYLLGLAKPDYEYLKKEFGLNKKQLKSEVLKKANSLNMKTLAKDTLPFLINPDDQQRILSFKEYIEQEL